MKAEEGSTDGPMLYGFRELPPLDVRASWLETHNGSVPANFHKVLEELKIWYCNMFVEKTLWIVTCVCFQYEVVKSSFASEQLELHFVCNSILACPFTERA